MARIYSFTSKIKKKKNNQPSRIYLFFLAGLFLALALAFGLAFAFAIRVHLPVLN